MEAPIAFSRLPVASLTPSPQAIALSLGQAAPAPAAAAAPLPPWAPSAGPTAGGGGGAAASSSPAPSGGPQQQLQAASAAAVAQFAHLFATANSAAGGGGGASGAGAQRAPLPPPPPQWWGASSGPLPHAAPLVLTNEAGAADALGSWLGVAVAPPPLPGAPPPPPPSSGDAPLLLSLLPGAPPRALAGGSLLALVRARIAPRRLGRGTSELAAVADAFRRAAVAEEEALKKTPGGGGGGGGGAAAAQAAASQTAALASAFCSALASSLSSSLLADAGGDLYYDGGRLRTSLVGALGAPASSPGGVPQALLDALVSRADSPAAARMWEDLLRTSLGALSPSAAGGEAPLDDAGEVASRLRPLDRLTAVPALSRALGCILFAEAAAAAGAVSPDTGCFATSDPRNGGFSRFEARSVMAPLLSFGPLSRSPGPTGVPSQGAVASFARLPVSAAGGAPSRGDRERHAATLGASASLAASAGWAVIDRVARQKGAFTEAALAWLAAAVASGAGSAAAGSSHHSSVSGSGGAARGAASDAFAVGVTAVCFRLCRPFLGGEGAPPERSLAARDRLVGAGEAGFFGGAAGALGRDHRLRRLRWPRDEALLTTQLPPAPTSASASASASSSPAITDAPPVPWLPFFAPPLAPACPPGPHFVIECFALALAALRAGLGPASCAFERARYAASHGAATAEEAEALGRDARFCALTDAGLSGLLDHNIAGDACRLALLTSAWLLGLASLGAEHAGAESAVDNAEAAAQRQRRAFARVPASVVRDVASFISIVLRFDKADLLSGAASAPLPVAALVEACCALLTRRDLVSSPLVVASLVDLLHALLCADASARGGGGGGLGRTGSAAHDALVGSVLGNPAARQRLCPALVAAYPRLDAVEGLDVDADDFDKFTVRNRIARLLQDLWELPECVASVKAMAADAAATQQQQAAAGGCGGDASAPPASSPFADFASAALLDLMYLLQDALARLVDIRDVQAAQADAPAWAALPPATRRDKERFLQGQENAARGFMGQARATLRLLNRLAATPAVAAAFLGQPVAGGAAYAVVHFLELLLGPKCEELKVANPEKYKFHPKELLLGIVEFTLRLDSASVEPAFAAAVGCEEDYSAAVLERAGSVMAHRSVGDATHTAGLRTFIGRCEAARAAARGEPAPSPSPALDAALSPSAAASASGAAPLSSPLSPAEDAVWRAAYVLRMAPLLFREVPPGGLLGFFRQFEELAARSEGSGSKAKGRAVGRELAALSSPGGLPLEGGSAIVVRTDSQRMDKLRALITGPEGTPYALGCFVFDVLFPADYPHKAPLVNFDTTGGGRVRFNPNLYADGKVCLSLLGTWHASHESEKWHAGSSTLSQALLSIQAMILIDEPWFNEPGSEGMRGTEEGAKRSRLYNEELRLHTLRHAVRDQLRKPRAGLEDAIRAHFAAAAPALRAQCAAWLAASTDEASKPRLQEVVSEVLHELDKLDGGGAQAQPAATPMDADG